MPVAAPSNRASTVRMPSTRSTAATRCISDVPGLAKHTSTPDPASVRIRLSAPFTVSSSRRGRWYRFGHESVPRAGPGLARGRDPCLNEYSSGGILAARTRTEAMNRSSPGALEIRDVTVRFGGVTALDAVSLTAAPRQVTGIIGPNGAGKTTLLNVVCGFVRPDAGQLAFDGVSLARVRPRRLAGLGIARTLQGLGLFPRLSVLENVMVGADCHARAGFWTALAGLPDADERRLRDRAREALDRVGAADLAGRRPDELPYGMRKRV